VDEEAKAYVPSRYAACLNPADATETLSGLPAAAQDLLATARRINFAALGDVEPAFSRGGARSEACFDIATEEARALATILEAAGEHPDGSWDGLVSYDMLSLWPMLPHGVPAFTGA
jgi:hypothetical protein